LVVKKVCTRTHILGQLQQQWVSLAKQNCILLFFPPVWEHSTADWPKSTKSFVSPHFHYYFPFSPIANLKSIQQNFSRRNGRAKKKGGTTHTHRERNSRAKKNDIPKNTHTHTHIENTHQDESFSSPKHSHSQTEVAVETYKSTRANTITTRSSGEYKNGRKKRT